MCFNKVEGPKTLRRHTLVKNSITQITGDFIKKIGEIFKESEKLYETEEKNQIANAKFSNKPCEALY